MCGKTAGYAIIKISAIFHTLVIVRAKQSYKTTGMYNWFYLKLFLLTVIH